MGLGDHLSNLPFPINHTHHSQTYFYFLFSDKIILNIEGAVEGMVALGIFENVIRRKSRLFKQV